MRTEKTGLVMPAGILQPTVPLDDPPADKAQGSGPLRDDAGEKGRGRKLTLPDSVFERLVLTALERGSTASAIAAEILDRNLPRLRIAADE
jgi:hypothetical protein